MEDYANLKAQRKLEGNDLAELPAKSDTPQMTITLGAGEQTVDLTVCLLYTSRACTTRSSTSGNLFIKCGLSSKSGGPHFLLKKAAFFSKNRLTFLLPAVIIIHVVRATAHGEKNMRMWRNWQTR